MSLLMQALNKAASERHEALTDAGDAKDADNPPQRSKACDQILALTPDDVLAGRVPPAPPAADSAAWSLEALAVAEARALAPAGSVDAQLPALAAAIPAPHDPTPRQSLQSRPSGRAGDAAPGARGRAASPSPDPADARLPSAPARLQALTLQDVPPELIAAPYFVSAASPPDLAAAALGTEAIAPMRAVGSAMTAAPAAAPADPAAPGPHGATATADTYTETGAAAGTDTPFSAPGGASRSTGAAARARAAAQAAARQDTPGPDPARVRLALLGGALALVAATLAGVYWYALTAPGPGARLPPVPMPPPAAASGTTQVALPVASTAPSDAQALPATTPAGALPAAAPVHSVTPSGRAASSPPPGGAGHLPSDDDLQRALQQPSQATTAGQPPPPTKRNPGNAVAPATKPASAANPAPLAASPPAADIHVARGAPPQRLDTALQDGYQAFMAGNDSSAAQHYASALRQDPNNRDALLGHAAIAARRNDIAAATAGYQRLLELDPNDADAQAGLLGLRPGDLGQSELRLKDLLRREPGAGPLEFALGNLYAQQGRWPDAQQAYFRAYASAPENADYAFNLAVGLDRLGQRALARTYYQRALALAHSGPAAFERSAARRRADQLAAPAGGSGNESPP